MFLNEGLFRNSRGLTKLIIGITGTLGAGKGTIVEFLKTKGFNHFSARTFISEEIIRRGLPVNRDNLVIVANDLRKKHSPSYVAEKLFKRAQEKGGDAILESLRTEGEIKAMRNLGNFTMFAIDANPELRYERIVKRKSSTDNVSFEKFIADEKKEFTATDPTKQNLSRCIELSDHVFNNNGTIEELQSKVEKVLNKIGD